MKDKIVSSTAALNADFWNNKYLNHTTGWDLGAVSPPLNSYIDSLDNKDLAILIPGAGNAYEATYLADQGFKNITIIDIAPSLIADLRSRTSHQSQIHIIEGDFFAHQGQYELILEQTFFCALDPGLRRRYIDHMHELLQQGGLLAGVLFNRYFDQAGPPFGGDLEEYQELFSSKFEIKKMELCNNSHPAREGSELFIECKKG